MPFRGEEESIQVERMDLDHVMSTDDIGGGGSINTKGRRIVDPWRE